MYVDKKVCMMFAEPGLDFAKGARIEALFGTAADGDDGIEKKTTTRQDRLGGILEFGEYWYQKMLPRLAKLVVCNDSIVHCPRRSYRQIRTM
jgi:hypothetical protein